LRVYKAVIQVPSDNVWVDDLMTLRWQANSNPHGPHIKVYPGIKDAETGEECVQIRCKHQSIEELNQLLERVVNEIQEHEAG